MEAAGVEELQSELDINITEEHQDVTSFPGVCSNIQPSTSGKLLIHWDQGVVGETFLSAQVDV